MLKTYSFLYNNSLYKNENDFLDTQYLELYIPWYIVSLLLIKRRKSHKISGQRENQGCESVLEKDGPFLNEKFLLKKF